MTNPYRIGANTVNPSLRGALGSPMFAPMSFGPNDSPTRVCPSCNVPVLTSALKRCPVCHTELAGPGEVGKALVKAMTDFLGDRTGRPTIW